MNKVVKLIINFSAILIIAVALIVGNTILPNFESEISTLLSPPIVDTQSLALSSQNGQNLSARIMEEGATLLKNDGALPLDYETDKKVNVFGWRSIDWIYGSEGQNASGGVAPEDDDFSKNIDIYKALKKYGVQYNEKLFNMYYQFEQPKHQSANLRAVHISTVTPLREPNVNDRTYYSQELLDYSEEYSDVAIVMIGRMAGEGMNCSTTSQVKGGPGATDDYTRHYLEISVEEEELLKYVGANYEKVIVLLNVANPFECGFLETIPGIDACMYIGFTGTRAAISLPKLLYGEVSPSGKLIDTFPYDMFTNPANNWLSQKTFTDFSYGYVDYVEGIYVGYKWYETADVEGVWDDVDNVYGKGYEGVVQFPFGYGQSYNTYSWTIGDPSLAPGSAVTNATTITFPVTVKNNGNYPGREVVAIYATVPWMQGGIEKASVQLVTFAKTNLLQPGAEETIEVTVDFDDVASYDCYDMNGNGHKGYELEAGTYSLKFMTDSHTVKTANYAGDDAEAIFDYVVEETQKITHDKDTGNPVGNLFTGEDAVDTSPLDGNEGSFVADIPWFKRGQFTKPETWGAIKNNRRAATPSAKSVSLYGPARAKAWDNATGVDEFGDPIPTTKPTWGANNGKKLAENGVITELGKKLGADFNAPEWEAVLDQLQISEVVSVVNHYYGSKAIASVGKPYISDLDGPSQIKGFNYAPRGTGYPTMVTIAMTWNPKLAFEFGKSYGDDMIAVGVTGVWGWAMDMHRTAFFGRNHESPSEDGMLAGIMISNAVKGLYTRGRNCYIKHFALYGTAGSSIWLTEQAFREIYLKGFRMAFVDGGALGCMTTYQGIGIEHSETTVALLKGVLRKEWGFNGSITTDYIGHRQYCDAIIRMSGNLGMGVSLGSMEADGVVYNSSSSARLQHRLRESAKQVLYTWLRTDYRADDYAEYSKLVKDIADGKVNKEQYIAQNPEKWAEYQKNYPVAETGETMLSTSTIMTWIWWKPLVASVNVCATTLLVMWGVLILIGTFVPNKKKGE